MRTASVFSAVVVCSLLTAHAALAQPAEPVAAPPANPLDPDAPVPPPPPAPVTPPKPPEPGPTDPVHPDDPKRKEDLTPHPTEHPTSRGQKFTADPIADTGVIALGVTFGILSEQLLSTGEIRPQQISPTFQTSQLVGIDRGAIRQTNLDEGARQRSNFGLYFAAAFAVGDVIADIFREGRTAALVDAIMYAEAVAITQGVTNLAKIAFRRPRPQAYIERNEFIARNGPGSEKDYDNSDTDSALSFFSGHASATATIASAATYIAFARSGARSPRPWLTLGGGMLLTTFVSYERVKAGAHFPTDVLAGALAGTAVGALVVHLHREDSVKQRPVWIGVTPSHDGGILSASGLF